VSFADVDLTVTPPDDELLRLDEALTRLTSLRPQAAQLIKLRFFGGLGIDAASEVVGVSPRTARRLWLFGQAWLRREMDVLGDLKSLPCD